MAVRNVAGSRGAGTDDTSANADAMPLLRSMWPREASHNLRIGFAMSGLIAGKALAIYAPVQLGYLVDTLGAGVEVLPIGILAAYGLARLGNAGFNELRSALFASVSQATCRALARRSFEHLHSLDTLYLISNKPGTLITVVSRATRSLTLLLNMLLFNVFPILVEFSMALAVLTYTAGLQCAFMAGCMLGVYGVFTAQWSNKRRTFMQRRNKAEEAMNGVFFDSLTNCEVVKYFQNERLEVQRYDSELANFEREEIKVLQSLALLNFGQQVIVISGFMGILGLTATQVMSGAMQPGEMVAIHGIIAQLMQPLGMLGGVYRVTTQGFVDLGKLAGFLNRTTAVPLPPGGGDAFAFQRGGMEFRNVHFGYRHAGGSISSVLKGASFEVHPGSKLAIVGPSGSGKSTLLRLLYRLDDPQEGQVFIDGQDVRKLEPESFRQHLGIVPQDCTLFNATLGFNIRYGRSDATEEELEQAVRAAQIHELVTSLPQGYNTPVGERGLMLSGGERQRVGIARCLLRNPSIVLLDEATSSLDVATERELVEAMDSLMRDRTCLIIAHRLSTVERCDSVVFLQDGVVAEHGSHAELLQQSARYQQFWQGLHGS